MTEFLTAALGVILAMLALGLVRILRGPGEADRMMAAQLIGTGGIAALLLLGAVTGVPSAVDVALTVALLATFASIAFVKKGSAILGEPVLKVPFRTGASLVVNGSSTTTLAIAAVPWLVTASV